MADLLLWAAVIVLALTAAGLLRLLRGPGAADRIMAGQLFGTGGAAVLLLLGAGGAHAAIDVALTLALLSAFVSLTFAVYAGRAGTRQALGRGEE